MTTITRETQNSSKAWIMLLLASAFEVGYALSVAGSQAFTVLTWSAAALIFFLLTLYFLSAALKSIDVGIGYAVWAGIGSVGAAIFGSVLLHQPLTFAQGFWLAVIIAGVIWLKLADSIKLKRGN
jgi:quaternary ammonium compound-resistance protein SugE